MKKNHIFINIDIFQSIRPSRLWTVTSDTRDKRIVPVHHQVIWFDHIVHIAHIRKDKQSKSKVFKSPANACTWIKNGFATMLAHGWQSTQPRESTRALKPRAEVTRSPKTGVSIISGPTKRTDVLQKNLKKKFSWMKNVYRSLRLVSSLPTPHFTLDILTFQIHSSNHRSRPQTKTLHSRLHSCCWRHRCLH